LAVVSSERGTSLAVVSSVGRTALLLTPGEPPFSGSATLWGDFPACSGFKTQDATVQSEISTAFWHFGRIRGPISTLDGFGAVLGTLVFNESVSLTSSTKVLWDINCKTVSAYNWSIRNTFSDGAPCLKLVEDIRLGDLVI
jgi:hypothetical protein